MEQNEINVKNLDTLVEVFMKGLNSGAASVLARVGIYAGQDSEEAARIGMRAAKALDVDVRADTATLYFIREQLLEYLEGRDLPYMLLAVSDNERRCPC